MKVKIVYNQFTRIIPPHVWNSDGTVSIRGSDKDIIVSMIEACYIDFDNGRILEWADEKEKNTTLRM